jgi:enolase
VSAPRIATVLAWEALDSRGTPTVACKVRLEDGSEGTATVPSGASTVTHEAHELRDGGSRYGGRGVERAVGSVNGELKDAVIGLDATEQAALDQVLCEVDGTASLARLGGNAVLAVSLATAVAAASSLRVPLHRMLDPANDPLLPLPMVNIVSGGAHAAGAVDFQDFLVVPIGASTFREAIEWAALVRTATQGVLQDAGEHASLVADEGGLGARLASNRAALVLLAAGIERSALIPGEQVAIAVDVAATELWSDGRYVLAGEERILAAGELTAELAAWASEFPIVSIEDPLAEDDWEGWRHANETLGAIQLLGDDLFATNEGRLARGIEEGMANAVLVKPNQAGTLSRARRVVDMARASGLATVVSARSGDTEDAWLADLAVGWRAGQIKVGSTMRSERTAKWNRLLQIEAEAGGRAGFAGRGALAGRSRN